MNKRCVCGKVITSQYDLCNSCLAEYGRDSRLWPEWLIFAVADAKRAYYQDKIISDHEITFSDFEAD